MECMHLIVYIDVFSNKGNIENYHRIFYVVTVISNNKKVEGM